MVSFPSLSVDFGVLPKNTVPGGSLRAVGPWAAGARAWIGWDAGGSPRSVFPDPENGLKEEEDRRLAEVAGEHGSDSPAKDPPRDPAYTGQLGACRLGRTMVFSWRW